MVLSNSSIKEFTGISFAVVTGFLNFSLTPLKSTSTLASANPNLIINFF